MTLLRRCHSLWNKLKFRHKGIWLVYGVVLDKGSAITDEQNHWTAASIALYNTVRLRFKFTAENISNITVKIGSDTFSTFESLGNGIYYLEYDKFSAKDFATPITVVLCVDGTEVQTIQYCVNAYVRSFANNYSEENATYALVQAVYNYGVAAAAYQG